MPNSAHHFLLSVGEPWDFVGPDGDNRASLVLVGQVHGPNLPNWEPSYLLLSVVRPFILDGERVEQVVAAPRYSGDSLEHISQSGGTVGVARVRPGTALAHGHSFGAEDVRYCIIGSLIPSASER